jgi:hypothetical protein
MGAKSLFSHVGNESCNKHPNLDVPIDVQARWTMVALRSLRRKSSTCRSSPNLRKMCGHPRQPPVRALETLRADGVQSCAPAGSWSQGSDWDFRQPLCPAKPVMLAREDGSIAMPVRGCLHRRGCGRTAVRYSGVFNFQPVQRRSCPLQSPEPTHSRESRKGAN